MTEFTDLLKKFETEEDGPRDAPKVPILVVDDDASIRRGLGSVFSHKYEVLTAECGKDAVEALSDAVHCVILDVKMKEQNGFATYPKLKDKSPNVPIIFYTAFQSEHDLQGVINKFKPEGYVDKGQDITFLDNLVGNAVNKCQLILENEGYKQDLEKKVMVRTEELTNAMQELKVMQAHLVQNEKMAGIGVLAAGISHEINNGITSIDRIVERLPLYIVEYKSLIEELNRTLNRAQWEEVYNISSQLVSFSLQGPPIETSEIRKAARDIIRTSNRSIPLGVAKKLASFGYNAHSIDLVVPLLEMPNSELVVRFLDLNYKLGNALRNLSIGKERIKEIVVNMKEYSHQEGSELTNIHINKGLEVTLVLMSNLLKYGVNVVRKFYSHLPQPIGNPGKINQVWTNILNNAVQAMNGKGDITIETYLSEQIGGKYVCVKISDTGAGIAEKNLSRIFDPFFTTKDVGEGTGLGLWIVASIIKEHSGKIDIYSQLGEGTSVEVSLPIQKINIINT